MNALDILMYGQSMVMKSIDRLRPDDWTQIALGTWTTKDLVGHLAAFEVRTAEILALFAGAEPATDLRSADNATFNDDQAAIRAGWSVDEVKTEFAEAYDLAMAHARAIEPDIWPKVGTIPWYGAQYSLDDLIVYTMYGHKREHNPQFEQVLDRPGR
jgi:Mycothiol maleylpyruvate isomerase N-terminal domain